MPVVASAHILMTCTDAERLGIGQRAEQQAVTSSVFLRRAVRAYTAMLGAPMAMPDLKRYGRKGGNGRGWTHTKAAKKKMSDRAKERYSRRVA